MREQTGLDALATLCGGVANAASSNGMKSEQRQQQQQHPQQQQHQKQHSGYGAMHHHSSILNTQHPVAAAASNPNSSLMESSSNNGGHGGGGGPSSQNPNHFWYQAFMNAAAYGGLNPLLSQVGANSIPNAAAAAAMSNHLQQQQSSAANAANAAAAAAGVDPNSLSAVQQLAFISAYQAAAAAAQNPTNQANKYENDILNNSQGPPFVDRNLAAMMLARAQQQQQQQQSYQMNNVENNDRCPAPAPPNKPQQQQHMLSSQINLPSPPAKSASPKINPQPFPKPQEVETVRRTSVSSANTEKKYRTKSTQSTTKRQVSKASSQDTSSGPLNVTNSIEETSPSGVTPQEEECEEPEGKKLQKRAANRRSAQLSRKRKKQFIEELKEENDDLRRKEQILSSIPDLVVAFALCGKILFISNSVETFLGFKPDELENSCFWDRLCVDSIRLLKAAFMDALVAKKPGVDVTPLGEGLWEVRLVDKQGTPRLVSLNGVVHFSSDNPECVCSIRPIAIPPRNPKYAARNNPSILSNSKSSKISFSSNEGSSDKDSVKPQQSVLNTLSGDDASVVMLNGNRSQNRSNGRGPLQVSDGDSFISESNSDE